MLSSKAIVGLPVFSIGEVAELGRVRGMLINPETGTVDYIAVDRDGGYRECSVVAFKDVEGIGPDALTVRRAEVAKPLSAVPEAGAVLDRGVRLVGTRVMTKKGQIAGVLSEFAIDEETGRLTGLEIVLTGQDKPAGVIPTLNVMTYGRDFVAIDQEPDKIMVSGFDALSQTAESAPSASKKTPKEAPKVSDPLQYFEEKQKQFLLGRKVSQRIVAADGTVIAEEGGTVTQEIIDLAVKHEKYVELALHTGV